MTTWGSAAGVLCAAIWVWMTSGAQAWRNAWFIRSEFAAAAETEVYGLWSISYLTVLVASTLVFLWPSPKVAMAVQRAVGFVLLLLGAIGVARADPTNAALRALTGLAMLLAAIGERKGVSQAARVILALVLASMLLRLLCADVPAHRISHHWKLEVAPACGVSLLFLTLFSRRVFAWGYSLVVVLCLHAGLSIEPFPGVLLYLDQRWLSLALLLAAGGVRLFLGWPAQGETGVCV